MPYVVAHAKLETADFTSKVYLTDNNMFGMKWTEGRRDQRATQGLLSPEGNHYAHYQNDLESLRDLLTWFEYKNFPVSVSGVEQYGYELNQRNYFTSGLQSYISNLDYWFKKS